MDNGKNSSLIRTITVVGGVVTFVATLVAFLGLQWAIFSQMGDIHGDIARLERDLRGDIARLEKDLRGDIARLEVQIGQLQGDVERIDGDVQDLKGDFREVRNLLLAHLAAHADDDKVAVVEGGGDGVADEG